MYGDHPGSPRRDSRQNPGPQSSPDSFGALDAGSPLSDTGYTFGDTGSPFGDTGSPFGDSDSAFGGLEPARGTGALTLPDDRPASTEAEYGDVRVAGRPLGAGPAEMPEHGDTGHGELLGSAPAALRPAGAKAGLMQRPGARKAAVISVAAVVLAGGGGIAMAMAGGSKGSADKDSGTVQPAALPDAAKDRPQVDTQALDAQRRRLAVQRAAKAARGELRHKPVWKVKGSPLPSPTATPGGGGAPSAGNPAPIGQAQAIAKQLLPSFGFNADTQFGCLVNLWNRESGWRTNAANPSGAYGIPQALPGVKMAKYGSDWRTNPKTQIKWGLSYIKGRYHTPCGAWAAFQRQGFY